MSNFRRRLMMKQGSDIPSIYKKVEYLQNTKSNRINLNLPWSTALQVKVVFEIDTKIGNSGIFGARTPGNWLFLTSIAIRYRYDYENTRVDLPIAVIGEKVEFETKINGNVFEIYWNGEKVESLNYQRANIGFSPYLFDASDSGIPLGSFRGKIYEYVVKDEDGNELINMTPTVRVSDNIAGMYDSVSNLFDGGILSNFTAGPDVN